jgi:hypothetical protein
MLTWHVAAPKRRAEKPIAKEAGCSFAGHTQFRRWLKQAKHLKRGHVAGKVLAPQIRLSQNSLTCILFLHSKQFLKHNRPVFHSKATDRTLVMIILKGRCFW